MSPSALRALTRPQLCGRITALRHALDVLGSQADRDRGAAYDSTAALERELAGLELHLRATDRPATWPHGALGNPAAEARLRTAGADLAETVREIAIDGARAMANTAAHHRALALEETARIRERAELNRIPPDEMLELAPDTARELSRMGGTE